MDQIVQGSPEWFAIRAGKVTASRIGDVTARDRSGKGWGVSRTNYAAQLIAERLTGKVSEGYTNAAMQHGIDTEAEARAAYQFYANSRVTQVGFVLHPTIGMTGASPDGLVGTDGIVQFKCPQLAQHIDTLMGGSIAGGYQKQMTWELACTGRAWCDFASYNPDFPESMRLHVTRIVRDDARIAELEGEVITFLAELSAKERELRKRYEAPVELTEPERILMVG